MLIVIVAVVVWRMRAGGMRIAQGSYLHLRLEGTYVEQPSDIIGKVLGEEANTLIDVLEALQISSRDPRIAGAIVEVAPLDVGWAKAEDLRDALMAFKATGKPLYAVLEQEAAASNLEYFVASAATKVYLSPASTAPLIGLAAQSLFLGGVWEKLDIKMHVEKIAEYKTFGDMLVNKTMSAAHREMANSLLDSIEARFISGIAEARNLTPEKVREIVDSGPDSAEDYQQAGLADGQRYVSEIRKGEANDAPLVKLADYQNVNLASIGLAPAESIAVVYGVGGIVQGNSGRSPFGTVMGANTISEAIDEAAENEDAKAIIFRVDSPGGSALASDLVWHATQRAREKKPVIVSMSDVAGSGGYYIAAGATRILAQPTTLTGSIGVVFTRPQISGLMEKLGISSETISRGQYARINDLTAPFDEATRLKLLGEIEHIYAVFVDRVARGRRMTEERVNELGRGRVWTGDQARENGLVDETGGFLSAIAAAKVAAGIAPNAEVELLHYPRSKPFAERLMEALTTRVGVATSFPGEDEVRAAFAAFPFVEGGVLTLMPESIRIE